MKMGRQTVKVVRNKIAAAGSGSEYVGLLCEDEEGEAIPVRIWLTRKATGMAKRSLALLGFDFMSRDLAEIHENPELFKGRKLQVDISTEEWQGNPQTRVQIVLDDVDTKRIGKIQQRMRSAATQERKAAEKDGFTRPDDSPAAGAVSEADEPPAEGADDDDIPF